MLKGLFFKLWKDPVWSKVISAAIIGAALLLWNKLGKESFDYILAKFLESLPVPVWAIVVVLFALIVSVIKHIPKRKELTEPVNYDADILAILDSWWPESEGQFPSDVAVNFQELETKLNLAQGSVGRVIDVVARRNCFKIKFRGQQYAKYEYDLQAAFK